MGLFWKRKSGDQFVSLKLNEPSPVKTPAETPDKAPQKATEGQPQAESTESVHGQQSAASFQSSAPATALEPVVTGSGPTPVPADAIIQKHLTAATHPQASARGPEAA